MFELLFPLKYRPNNCTVANYDSLNIQNIAQLWNLGIMLARLVPRCTDPDLQVRQQALDCIQTVLKINLRYQGNKE